MTLLSVVDINLERFKLRPKSHVSDHRYVAISLAESAASHSHQPIRPLFVTTRHRLLEVLVVRGANGTLTRRQREPQLGFHRGPQLDSATYSRKQRCEIGNRPLPTALHVL